MSYYNLCGIGSQHSNISKGKWGGGYTSLVCKSPIKVEIKMCHWIYVLKVVMNKKNPEQISSGSFIYLLNLGRVTSVSGVAKECFD